MRTAVSIVMALNVAGSLSADEDWRQFRGPTGQGHTSAQRLPLSWSENQKIVWKTDRSFDYATVPVHKRKAFTMPLLVPRGAGRQLVSPAGQAVYAYDPATGEELWYSASPIHAGNRICFFNEDAVCTVIRPGRKFEELAVNRLNEQSLMASSAVAGNSFFIRTERHLYRVEETTP